jgi:hypothetical protein
MTPEHLMRTLYLAAENAGLLSTCVWQGPAVGQDAVVTQTHAVSLRASDEGVLDGLALSTAYTITYPASVFKGLGARDVAQVDGVAYQVREVRAIGDGSEMRARLTRL